MDGLVDRLGTGRCVILVSLRQWFLHGRRQLDKLTGPAPGIGLGAAAASRARALNERLGRGTIPSLNCISAKRAIPWRA